VRFGPAITLSLSRGRLLRRLLVASFGGYADLGNVIAYITTGIQSFGGRRSIESERDRDLLGAIAAEAAGGRTSPAQPAPGRRRSTAGGRLWLPRSSCFRILHASSPGP
jgi:hypothetical protein